MNFVEDIKSAIIEEVKNWVFFIIVNNRNLDRDFSFGVLWKKANPRVWGPRKSHYKARFGFESYKGPLAFWNILNNWSKAELQGYTAGNRTRTPAKCPEKPEG